MVFPAPECQEILRFAEIVFQNADPAGYVNLRAFFDAKEGAFASMAWRSVRLDEGIDKLADEAFDLAAKCASFKDSVVFCPPVATFRDGGGAGEENVLNGVVLIIECDRHPRKSVEMLESLIGPATIIVASGGVWEDPDNNNAAEDKLHAYWRLSIPTRTADEHANLKEARRLASIYSGSDPTSGPVCHPIRWPGSWHRKAEPRLATMVAVNPEAEIFLSDALGRLRAVAPEERYDSGAEFEEGEVDVEDLRSALDIIPNADADWDYWNSVGMAIWKATGGSEEGMALFDAYSAKSAKYNKGQVTARWRHYWGSPPSRTGAGKLFAEAIKVNPRWRRRQKARRESPFFTDARGNIITNDVRNVRIGLQRLTYTLSYDEFADRILYVNGASHGSVSDSMLDDLWFRFEEDLRFRPNNGYFRKAVENTSRRSSFNPVKDYLSPLWWDGRERVKTWLIDYAGAQGPREYVEAVSSLILIAAVARVYQPGCKFDEMLVLESPQGADKSSAVRLMAVRDEWFTDGLELGSRSREIIEQISGKWLVESSDLTGIHRSEVEAIKQFLSKQSDRARLAYAHQPTERFRQCVFFGTTNSSRYLRDEQNRRFWPLRITLFDLAALRGARDQLWAEAKHLYDRGASIRLDPSLYALAEFEQEARRIEDQWIDDLGQYFGGITGRVIGSDVFKALGLNAAQHRGQNENQRVGESMRQLGWDRVHRSVGGVLRWCYERGDGDERKVFVSVNRDPLTGEVSIMLPTPVPASREPGEDDDGETTYGFDDDIPFR